MRLKLGKPTRMWATITNDTIPCGLWPLLAERRSNAQLYDVNQRVERVLVTVTRVGDALNYAGLLDCLAACREFVRKCDVGLARSKYSYHEMKTAIAKAETRIPAKRGKGK